MKTLYTIFLMICLCTFAQANNPNHKWFEESRFGMFIHFGPYSVLCDGEWVLNSRQLKFNSYKNLQQLFNPIDFNAEEWVKIAKDAGMKYITFTSRHHDGFSMWDTKQSDWNIMNTPYGKDIVRQLADECHKEGIKLVLYYSLLDWGSDDYSYWTGRTGQHTGRSEKGNWESYIQFMKAQLTELLTNYGEIAGIWFDGEWDQMDEDASSHEESQVDWYFKEIYDLIHTLQPNCMIANNHHLNTLEGEDYEIFERDLPGENNAGYSGNKEISQLPLETCETINNSWGYRMKDDNFKSSKELIHLLVRAAGYGANLLLNVGPMPNGKIQDECIVRLKDVGEWMKKYGETIYGTKAGNIKPQSWGAITCKGDKTYIHILDNELKQLTIKLPQKIKSAKWYNIDSKLIMKQDKKTGDITFDLSNVVLNEINSIIEVR